MQRETSSSFEKKHKIHGLENYSNISSSVLWSNIKQGLAHANTTARNCSDISLPPIQLTPPPAPPSTTLESEYFAPVTKADQARDLLKRYKDTQMANYNALASQLRLLGYGVNITEIAPLKLMPEEFQVKFRSFDESMGSLKRQSSNEWNNNKRPRQDDWSGSDNADKWNKRPRFNNDRYDDDRSDRRGRGGGRGRGGRGRGRGDFNNNYSSSSSSRYNSQNDNYSSATTSTVPANSGWSDNEDKSVEDSKPKANDTSNAPGDDWDDKPVVASKPKQQNNPIINDGENWDI